MGLTTPKTHISETQVHSLRADPVDPELRHCLGERWMLKDRSEAEQAAWKIIFTALRLDYINEGPPPPDEERDSRLTNDLRLHAIIDSRYRQVFSEDPPALEGLEIEAVTPRSR